MQHVPSRSSRADERGVSDEGLTVEKRKKKKVSGRVLNDRQVDSVGLERICGLTFPVMVKLTTFATAIA